MINHENHRINNAPTQSDVDFDRKQGADFFSSNNSNN